MKKSKNKNIIDLFAQYFKCDISYTKGKAGDFCCPYQQYCKVDKKTEPIWSPALGCEGSKVMVVAEAPSVTRSRTGPHIGGRFADWTDEASVSSLLEFVRNYYQTTPHFTDLMKCGFEKQAEKRRNKELTELRKEKCIKQFLLEEIRIIDPKVILCVGKEAFDALQKCQNECKVKKSITPVNLIHYSKQAGLPLTSDDKKKLIWPFQVGQVCKNKRLSELSFFKNKKTEENRKKS